ncbi:MAG TPA: mycofactocin-coupled SDR family oxidoreductase [Acidimicrobiales bacterium]|nr:mycofactocin-coupled SDR family oxidoreductase [Acidimicrobiales bacterium]
MKPVAVVTGAARGIGAATVRALAAEGWCVLAVDRCEDDPAVPYRLASAADLEAVAEGAGPDVVAAPADVRDPATLSRVVHEAEERWGGVDAAIAAAAVIAGGARAWEVPLDAERAVLDVDLGGVLSLARAAVPAMLRRPAPRRGRFLAVSSAADTRGLPMLAAYCAAKAGVDGYVRALAVELADHGITANAVSPGSTDTAMLHASARIYDLPAVDSFAARQPIRRLLAPEEVARVLVFLAGESSGGITGAVVRVDGGLSL